jgi:hypothetical protein
MEILQSLRPPFVNKSMILHLLINFKFVKGRLGFLSLVFGVLLYLPPTFFGATI